MNKGRGGYGLSLRGCGVSFGRSSNGYTLRTNKIKCIGGTAA